MRNEENLYPQPETVHIEKLKEDLKPFESRVSALIKENRVILIGEEDHYDRYTPGHTLKVLEKVVEDIKDPLIVFLECTEAALENPKHFARIVRYCEEKHITLIPVDTVRNESNITSIERDQKMLENINAHVEANPDYKFVFVGGSSHCNKSGRHEKSPYEEYSQENLATLLLAQGEKVGSITLHLTKPLEALARDIDSADALMCLPGSYAPLYYQKRFIGFEGLTELQWHADEDSFDLLTFVPTTNSLINRSFGHHYDRHTVYLE